MCLSLIQIIALTFKVMSFLDWKEKRLFAVNNSKIADVVSVSTAAIMRK